MTQQKSREEKLKRIDYKTVQNVMKNFSKAFKDSLTSEQRKKLLSEKVEK